MDMEKEGSSEINQINKIGRPKLYNSPAEKQKAYRERLKTNGKREVKRIVNDTRLPNPLKSSIIDLSEVRKF